MIKLDLSVMLAKRKMTTTELAEKLELSLVNTSLLKNGKVKGIRFATLDKICEILDCSPSDIIFYEKNQK